MSQDTLPAVSKAWNPLLAQLRGAAAMGSAASHLVLQSLVAQSALVLENLMVENERLQSQVARLAQEVETLQERT